MDIAINVLVLIVGFATGYCVSSYHAKVEKESYLDRRQYFMDWFEAEKIRMVNKYEK